MRRSTGVALAAAAAVFVVGGGARANGRYPAASLVVFDPNDANHFVMSATIGLLESRDGGTSFRWRCESVLGAPGPQDLMTAITATGATVTAKFDGVVTSSDGCSFFAPPELAGKSMGDLALRRSTPHELVAFYIDSRIDGGFDSQLVRSDDDGHTWAPLGAPLPIDLLPQTIDVAPSDASRVYVSARFGPTQSYASTLLRSKDGGVTFDSTEIPETANHHLAYIAAVHPFDPDRIYLRVYDPLGTLIWLSDDGGLTFRKVFTGTDQIYGFAVSPDGMQIALGGPGDGTWVGAADGTGFTRRADIQPNCLAWSADGLFACADQMVAPFSLGRSRDMGATFETVLRFDALCGQTGCGADTDAGLACARDWELVAPAVGTTCGTDAGTRDAPPSDAPRDHDASREASPIADAPPGAADGPEVVVEASGGACAMAPFPGKKGTCALSFGLFGFLAAGFRWRRRDQFLTVT